jgi:hypothetical protein
MCKSEIARGIKLSLSMPLPSHQDDPDAKLKWHYCWHNNHLVPDSASWINSSTALSMTFSRAPPSHL